jgi:CBS domain-containing protein
MAYVEGHYHSEPFGRQCSQRWIVAAQRVGRRKRYRLDPKFIRPQQTPGMPVINKSKRMVGIISLGDVSRSASGDLLTETVRSVSAHH